MPKTDFRPDANGFHFANGVFNVTLLPIKGFPPVRANGLCGGMSFAALDHFFSSTPIPKADFADRGGLPPDGSPLQKYIFTRQLDSFTPPRLAKFAVWSLPEQSALAVLGQSVPQLTKQVEFVNLQKSIDQNIPVPLGLIRELDHVDLGEDHQVVAYGYELDPVSDKIKVFIYDVNYPGEEIVLTSNKTMPGFVESSRNGERWRGFFVQTYARQTPPANLAPMPATGVTAKDLSVISHAPEVARGRRMRVVVTLRQIVFDHTAGAIGAGATGDVALLISVNSKHVRWPKTGLKRVSPGKRYRLNRRIELSLSSLDKVSISATLADKHGRPITPFEKRKPVGKISATYDKADDLGQGRHHVRSTGKAGAYTLDYRVDVLKHRG